MEAVLLWKIQDVGITGMRKNIKPSQEDYITAAELRKRIKPHTVTQARLA